MPSGTLKLLLENKSTQQTYSKSVQLSRQLLLCILAQPVPLQILMTTSKLHQQAVHFHLSGFGRKVLSRRMLQLLMHDRVKLPDRGAMFVVGAVAHALGVDEMFIGMPAGLEEELMTFFQEAMKSKTPRENYMELPRLCYIFLGGS
jgi:hypothetical protein